MTIIQGGPKPVVVVPVDVASRSQELREALPAKATKPVSKTEAAARYAAEKAAAEQADDPREGRGKRVDVDA